MAVGLVLWVAWISLLLDSGVFIEAQSGIKYRQTYDRMNLVDTKDFSDSLNFDEEGSELPVKLSKVVNQEYKKSPAAKPLKLFSVSQKVVNKPERLVNGASRQWQANVFEPITFPLQTGSKLVAQTQPESIHESRAAPLAAYGDRKPVGLGEITTGPQMPKPVQGTNLAVSPPSFESWQPVPPTHEAVEEPVAGSLYQPKVDSNAAAPEFVGFPDNDPFSENFNMVELPPANFPTQKQPSRQYPDTKPQRESWSTPEWSGKHNEIGNYLNSGFPSWLGFPYTVAWQQNSPFESRGYDPKLSQRYNYLSQRLGATLPKAPQPPKPLPPRRRFIVHSKNGYHRQKLLNTKTTYTPDYTVPKGKYSKSVKVLRGAVQDQKPSRKI